MGISLRQVQRYLKQLSDLKLIVREGGRKNGIWKILDEEYEGFFKRNLILLHCAVVIYLINNLEDSLMN